MRPDRIIVGEVRGEEALDMLQAMNTGHDGSLTTVHANTPRDAISRLEVMVTLANANMHLAAIRQQSPIVFRFVLQLEIISVDVVPVYVCCLFVTNSRLQQEFNQVSFVHRRCRKRSEEHTS